jgi:hypothetical protein
VLVNDTELFAPNLVAGATYIFRGYIIYTSTTATPDFNLTFTGPAGSVINWVPAGISITATTDDSTVRLPATAGTVTRSAGTIAGVDMVVPCQGIIVTAGTAGTLQLQWSQRVATVENTLVRTNSWMYVERAT